MFIYYHLISKLKMTPEYYVFIVTKKIFLKNRKKIQNNFQKVNEEVRRKKEVQAPT